MNSTTRTDAKSTLSNDQRNLLRTLARRILPEIDRYNAGGHTLQNLVAHNSLICPGSISSIQGLISDFDKNKVPYDKRTEEMLHSMDLRWSIKPELAIRILLAVSANHLAEGNKDEDFIASNYETLATNAIKLRPGDVDIKTLAGLYKAAAKLFARPAIADGEYPDLVQQVSPVSDSLETDSLQILRATSVIPPQIAQSVIDELVKLANGQLGVDIATALVMCESFFADELKPLGPSNAAFLKSIDKKLGLDNCFEVRGRLETHDLVTGTGSTLVFSEKDTEFSGGPLNPESSLRYREAALEMTLVEPQENAHVLLWPSISFLRIFLVELANRFGVYSKKLTNSSVSSEAFDDLPWDPDNGYPNKGQRDKNI